MNVKNFIFTLLGITFIFTQTSAQSKTFFDYNEGLSNSRINKIFQDQKGFIWVATEDGLNRFDGIKFKSFHFDENDNNSLKNNFVISLAEGRDGNLWVGQINGLQVYNPESESFEEVELHVADERIHLYISSIIATTDNDIWMTTSGYGLIRIDHKTGKPDYLNELNKKLCSLNLRYIFEDSRGILWIGSDDAGLNAYDRQTGTIVHFSEGRDASRVLPSNNISTICEGDAGFIYVGSLKGGLARIDRQTNEVEKIRSANREETALPVKSLLFDSKQRLWAGTDGFGLKVLNPETNLLESHSPSSSTFDFSKSKIHSLIEDDAGNIWAGVFQKGLYLFAETPEIFIHYGYRAFSENSIGSSCVTAIEGNNRELWIGTDGDGIYKLDRTSQKIEHIPLKNTEGKIEGNNILTVHDSGDDFLWIGTYSSGLIRYNKKSRTIKTYRNDPDDPNSLVNDNITIIKEDENGMLWLGTLGGGVCRFDPRNEKFFPGFEFGESLNAKIPVYVNTFFIDQNHNYWIGTYVGLFFVNSKTGILTHFSRSDGTLRNNTVYAIQSDSSGNIWVGTYGGLVQIDINSFATRHYDTDDGLCNNVICAINEDEFNQLWLSTHNGLSRFDPGTGTFTNYFASDGIQSNEFTRNATFKTENHELFFGGINGITEVKRNYREYSRRIRDVMLTDFMRFNIPVEIGDKSGKHVILKKSIVLADTIRLHENDNVFSIGFTSVELAYQSRISYEYMMEGFDENWITTNSLNRRATYTNLGPGTYKFRVRGVDKEQYSNPRELTIIIYPKWYKTLWAKALWTILALGIAYVVIMLIREIIKTRHLEKMDEMKMQFFINISHEIKTPLTLIMDPLEKLLNRKTDEKTSKLYQVVYQNACRIYRLVNQLMDVRRIDKGMILVKFQQTNIYDFISEISHAYDLVSSNKDIHFSINAADRDIQVWIDPLNFEKVIQNLLSNAFKFTPSGGKIEIDITKTGGQSTSNGHPGQVKITVSDTGIGIKESDIEQIFNRFYQVDSKDPAHRGGTGVGLNLSRSLVSLHKGELKAENRTDGPGSRFTIVLPLGNSHLPKEDLIIDDNILPAPTHRVHSQFLPDTTKTLQKNVSKSKTNYKIMVVDDEEEIRDYLFAELSDNYKVVCCSDGKEAFGKLHDEKPDLVISDIMMPQLDGITLCKKIKGNMHTSHIPVILLTALSKDENRAEGIETGADMYIVKPFNSNFLKIIIANILGNRKKIYEKFKNENGHFDIEHVEIKSHDEILMQKVMTIIKNNIGNEKLNVEMLADGVGISRVHMHRKLKQITNQSARDLIRNIRMKQASYLLTNKDVNISEVAYALGYSNLSHFSSSFKNYYGVSPSEYTQKLHHKPAQPAG